MAGIGGLRSTRYRGHWRRLGAFWIGVLSLAGIGGGVLQYLGPPAATVSLAANGPPPPARPDVVATRRPPAGEAEQPALVATVRLAPPVVAGRDTPGPVTDPDPALLEPLSEGSKENLPRIASDGRTAMKLYAAGFDHSSRRPRIALLLAGIGMNEAESEAAIRTLPGAVSLAISPYAITNGSGGDAPRRDGMDANAPGATATDAHAPGAAGGGVNLARLLATARTTGHEYLIAIPLEPAGFPLNDPGPRTLLTGASGQVNARNLDWALSRVEGYVGATGVIGTMRGERLAAMTDQMDPVLNELAERGLLYIDPREDHAVNAATPISRAWGRHADLIIDDAADRGVADRAMIDARLAELEQRAKDTGSALGLVMRPTPVAVARIAAWSNGLADRGLTLAPVSALAIPPAEPPSVKLSERE